LIETGYDLTVPGFETFVNADGIVLSNTMNFHVPKSKEAVKEAYEFMLPSKSLIALTDMKSTTHGIISENRAGVYLASRPAKKDVSTKSFNTWEDAKKAFDRGEIGVNDPVKIIRNK
jgi:DNA-directed RNA polymerase beta' subunit